MQLSLRTAKTPIRATITLPGSPSISLRALLLAALADGVSEITDMHINHNTHALIHGLRQFGIVIQLDEVSRSCIVAGCNGKLPRKQATLDCDTANITTQFLLALSAATAGVYQFTGSVNTYKPAITRMLELLHNQGAQLIPGDATRMPFTLLGTNDLRGGLIKMEKATNALISSLLFIAPYTKSSVSLCAPLTRHQPIIELACAMMSEFGVLAHYLQEGHVSVPTPQYYQARDYLVEPDLDLAAYFFAAAAITQGTLATQAFARVQSKQPQVRFLVMLEKMGCDIIETPTAFTLKGPDTLQGAEISLRHFSDSLFALAAIAPFAATPTTIIHMGDMQRKEMRSLHLIKTTWQQLGIQVESSSDWIRIFPGTPKSGVVDIQQHHQLAMALSVMGLKAPGIVLKDVTCLEQHRPDFFTLWDDLIENTNIIVDES